MFVSFAKELELNSIEDYKNRRNIRVETAVELTEFCNLKCSYCNQGYLHKDSTPISFNAFKLVMTKFFKELRRVQDSCNLDILLEYSILGGELSVLYEQNKYFDYFNLVKKLSQEYKIRTNFTLLTNLTGKIDFFQQFIDLNDDYFETGIFATLHESYFNEKNIKKRMKSIISKINELNVHDLFTLDIAFLESESPRFKLMKEEFDKHITEIPYFVDIKIDRLLKIGSNVNGKYGYDYKEIDEYSEANAKYCNSMQYEFDFNSLMIIDQCRNIRQNILSWKIDDSFIECNRNCPYPNMWKDFIQLSESDYNLIKL